MRPIFEWLDNLDPIVLVIVFATAFALVSIWARSLSDNSRNR